jgi:hypothetical protein
MMKALLISGALFTALVASPTMADKKSENLPYAVAKLSTYKMLSDSELNKVKGGARPPETFRSAAAVITPSGHRAGVAVPSKATNESPVLDSF